MLQVNILIHIIFAIFLFSEFNNNYSNYSDRVNNPKVYIAFTALTFIESLLVLAANSYLIAFHTYLRCQGISTFDFILRRREKQIKENEKDPDSKTPSDKSFVINKATNDRENLHYSSDIVIDIPGFKENEN